MTKLVIDSSVILKWLNQENEKLIDKAEKVLMDAREGNVVLLVPELAKYEIGNALLLSKKLTSSQMKEAFSFLYSLPLKFFPHLLDLAESTYQIARKATITYYDASFIALAKQEDAILVTDNPKHQAKQLDVKVIPLKEY